MHPSYKAPAIPTVLPIYLRFCKNKLHSASGPDAISTWMLSTFTEEVAPSITSLSIWSLSLSLGNYQKLSSVIPIPKESNNTVKRTGLHVLTELGYLSCNQKAYQDKYMYLASRGHCWQALGCLVTNKWQAFKWPFICEDFGNKQAYCRLLWVILVTSTHIVSF